MSMGFELDISELTDVVKILIKKSKPEAVETALVKACWKILNDSVEESPKTPHRHGHLRESAIVNKSKDDDIMFGYTAEYAAKWHNWEGPEPNWSESGVGTKYVTTKIIKNKQEYLKLIGESLKKDML